MFQIFLMSDVKMFQLFLALTAVAFFTLSSNIGGAAGAERSLDYSVSFFLD